MLYLPQGKKKKKKSKNRKSEQSSADPSEDGRTYGIERLNIGESANYSKNESEWILAQFR